ncbi:MAG: hypothetical protein M3492_10090 [Actinomycetota bacterium]|nr:hypothetical protein [Actinomycetota bacterium]
MPANKQPARPAAVSRSARPRTAQKRPTKPTSTRPARREPAGEVVLGNVPSVTRLVGVFGILGGLLLAVSVVLPQLAVGDERVVLGDSLATMLVSWIWPVTIMAAGLSIVLGRYPRLGLAALGVAGAISGAGLLAALYWASQAAARGRYEIIAGRRLLTSQVEPLVGWYVTVAALLVLVAVGLAVGWLWSRVVMDDSESLDPGRPVLGGLAAVGGVCAVLALGATLVQIPDQVTVSQQFIAGAPRPVETVTPIEGAIGLFDRPGLALTAGLILSGVLVLFSVFATTLRPRLAVVGALGAFSAYLIALAVRALVDAARSTDIEATVGGWSLLVVGFGFAALTLLAWRWHPPVRPVTRELPMRPASRRALKKGLI